LEERGGDEVIGVEGIWRVRSSVSILLQERKVPLSTGWGYSDP